VHEFQQLDVGVVECGQRLAFRLEIKVENLGLVDFRVVKDPHDDADHFLDVLHRVGSRRTDE